MLYPALLLMFSYKDPRENSLMSKCFDDIIFTITKRKAAVTAISCDLHEPWGAVLYNSNKEKDFHGHLFPLPIAAIILANIPGNFSPL